TVSTPVTLRGSFSTDVDGGELAFSWAILSRPVGSTVTIVDRTAVNATFVPDRPGLYIAQLIVNDGDKSSKPATVSVNTGNVGPVANAGLDQTVRVGVPVQLDGSASFDPNGDPLTFQWRLVAHPTGSPIEFTSDTV